MADDLNFHPDDADLPAEGAVGDEGDGEGGDAGVTKERLLSAAGEIFADKGFKAATVREICAKAGANVAAVAYHFGGKEALYHATLAHWMEVVVARYPTTTVADTAGGRNTRERLERFVRAMMGRILDEEGKPAWHGRLMMREFMEPTSYTDEHVRRFVRPTLATLHGIIRDWLGSRATPDVVRRHGDSVIGQVLLYWEAKPMMQKIHGEGLYTPQEMCRTADHITRVTAAALDAEVRADD